MIPKSNRLLKLVLIEKKYFLRWSTAYSFSIRNYIEYWSALLEEEICPREASNWLSSMYSRRGHSNGSTRDVLYVQQEQATDEYCGKLLASLPEHSHDFAVPYPDFIPIPLSDSVMEGVSEDVYLLKKAEVDKNKWWRHWQQFLGTPNLLHSQASFISLWLGWSVTSGTLGGLQCSSASSCYQILLASTMLP